MIVKNFININTVYIHNINKIYPKTKAQFKWWIYQKNMRICYNLELKFY
jgi:hypothetical protein